MQYDHKTPHAFVFVFSLVSKKSLEDVCAAYEAVQKERKDEFPCLLLGTKLDLASQRQVTAIEANALAAKWENCVYHEVTAKYPQEVVPSGRFALADAWCR
jgi:GTPase SAR1 family protein